LEGCDSTTELLPPFRPWRSLANCARDFGCGLALRSRPQYASSYSRFPRHALASGGPSLCSGFRRRAQTPANRLNLEGCDSTTELLPQNPAVSYQLSALSKADRLFSLDLAAGLQSRQYRRLARPRSTTAKQGRSRKPKARQPKRKYLPSEAGIVRLAIATTCLEAAKLRQPSPPDKKRVSRCLPISRSATGQS
jgi:hypothetical protein